MPSFADLYAASTAQPVPPTPPSAPPRSSSFGALFGTANGSTPPPAPAPGGKSFGALFAVPDTESDVAKVGRGIGSFIGTVGNALDVPLAGAEGLIADATGAHGRLHQIGQDFQEGGGMAHFPEAVSNVANKDVYFRQGSLQRVIDDPNASESQKNQARWFLKNPLAAGAADFITEFANPSNLVGGVVGRGVGAVSRIPAIADALDEAQHFSGVGSRFAGMRLAGRDVARKQAAAAGKTASWAEQHQAAQAAENTARRIIDAPKHGGEEAYKQGMALFKNHTQEQQQEIVHRAQGNVGKSYGPGVDAELDERGKQLAHLIWTISRDQLREGTARVDQMYGKDEMFPGVFADIRSGPKGLGSDPLSDASMEEIAQRARSGERPDVPPPEPFDDTAFGTPEEIANRREHLADQHAAEVVKNDELNKRADMLAEHFKDDAQPPADHFSYFPMGKAFKNASRGDDYAKFLAENSSSGGGQLSYRVGTLNKRRTYATLKDAQENSQAGIRDDWSPVKSFESFAAQRNTNVKLENALKELMGQGIIRNEGDRTPNGDWDRFANTGDLSMSRKIGSPPSWRQKAAHQYAVAFLKEAGASKDDANAFVEAQTRLGKFAQSLPYAYGISQNLMRQGVVANPVVHGGWNLMSQYAAAGGNMLYLPYIFSGKLLPYIKLGPDEASRAMAEAKGAITARGAPRTIGGGSAIENASRPWSDLKPHEAVDRLGAQAQELNAKWVFDVLERRYAEALYKSYTTPNRLNPLKRVMSPEEAGNAVRQALGDYANISNRMPDAVLQKAFFFYPWLKTILPFWVKNGIMKPQTWNAPMQGLQTYNQLAGDPNFGTGTENMFSIYTGMQNAQRKAKAIDPETGQPSGKDIDLGSEPRPSYYDFPLVQRVLGQMGQIVGGALDSSGDEFNKGVKGLLLNRLNPVVAGGVNALQDLKPGVSKPGALVGGYAPALDRLQQMVDGFGDYVPGPIQAAYHVGQLLLGHETITPDALAGELVGGTGYVGVTPQQKKIQAAIMRNGYANIASALKRGDRKQAWTDYLILQNRLASAGFQPLPMVKKSEPADELNPLPLENPEGTEKREPLQETPETPPSTEEAEPGAVVSPQEQQPQ